MVWIYKFLNTSENMSTKCRNDFNALAKIINKQNKLLTQFPSLTLTLKVSETYHFKLLNF